MSSVIIVKSSLPSKICYWLYTFLIFIISPYLLEFFLLGVKALSIQFLQCIIFPPLLLLILIIFFFSVTEIYEFSEKGIMKYYSFYRYSWGTKIYNYQDINKVYMHFFKATELRLCFKKKDVNDINEEIILSPSLINFEKVFFFIKDKIEPEYIHPSYILYSKKLTNKTLLDKIPINTIIVWIMSGIFGFLIFLTLRWYIVR